MDIFIMDGMYFIGSEYSSDVLCIFWFIGNGYGHHDDKNNNNDDGNIVYDDNDEPYSLW